MPRRWDCPPVKASVAASGNRVPVGFVLPSGVPTVGGSPICAGSGRANTARGAAHSGPDTMRGLTHAVARWRLLAVHRPHSTATADGGGVSWSSSGGYTGPVGHLQPPSSPTGTATISRPTIAATPRSRMPSATSSTASVSTSPVRPFRRQRPPWLAIPRLLTDLARWTARGLGEPPRLLSSARRLTLPSALAMGGPVHWRPDCAPGPS